MFDRKKCLTRIQIIYYYKFYLIVQINVMYKQSFCNNENNINVNKIKMNYLPTNIFCLLVKLISTFCVVIIIKFALKL